MLNATYEPSLVLISFVVAVLASYTTLILAGRIDSLEGKNIYPWLIGGAIAMGGGIWSMHFIGMLAFQLPLTVGYDLTLTTLSLFIAFLTSGFSIWRVCRPDVSLPAFSTGTLTLGLGLPAMHYTGMAALRMEPGIEYDLYFFSISLLFSICVSGIGLWFSFVLKRNFSHVRYFRFCSSLIMGGGMVGTHYIGMLAADFPMDSICTVATEGVEPGWLAILVIISVSSIFIMALLASVLDARLESQTAKLASSLAEVNSELMQLALHDNLTKLPNRSLLEDRLKQMLHSALRMHSRFAILFMDLDGFKTINDSLGHHIGDLLLIEVSSRLQENLRKKDTVARLGGDEFVMLVEIAEPEDAAPIANKLLHAVNRQYQINGRELFISSSIGIAVFPENGTNQHDLLVAADSAMYHAKHMGRANYYFFDSSMDAYAHNHLEMTQDLRNALRRSEFRLHYQPKFKALDGSVLGAEALLRWLHPVRGLIGPDKFLGVAEKAGLISQIGDWVLDEACRQMSAWHREGFHDWKIAVNLSQLQFRNNNLVDQVQGVLAKHGLPPGSLILEVTETTVMQNVEASILLLERLVKIGVEISIDDFGAGHSSLLYLKRMRVSEIKIDQKFIKELSSEGGDKAIIGAIIELGHSLNLSICAEGVDTKLQKNTLTLLGCDAIQGHLVGYAMDAHQFITQLGVTYPISQLRIIGIDESCTLPSIN